MKSQRQNVLASSLIPIDLIIDIFLNLPAKSIARFRCLSKLWASLLRRKDFTELYLTKSSGRLQFLFACQRDNGIFFFSTHQPQNPDENSFVVITANRLAHFPCDAKVFAPVNGFFCLCLEEKKIFNGMEYKNSVSVLCNPSTGQTFTIPKPKTKRKVEVSSYIGFGHIDKQFKVLSMTWVNGRKSEEHQVMTLGTDECSWKMVECCIPHNPGNHYRYYGGAICINGVLYYKGKVSQTSEDSMIVYFDFRSKEFNVLKLEGICGEEMPRTSTLIDYNGKLGLLMSDTYGFSIQWNTKSFVLWVLEDDKKQEWSKHVYELPTSWEGVVGRMQLHFVGIIGTNEIVLAPQYYQCMFYHILFYNTERKTITRVEIQGLEAFKGYSVRTFVNYVDNVKLIPEL